MRRPNEPIPDARTTGIAEAGEAPPVRLFGSDFLERFTRTSLTTIILFWVSVSALCIAIGAHQGSFSPARLAFAIIAGAAIWTIVEYLLHRFVFHLDRWVPAARPLTFLIHGCHHADPSDAGRDIMPLAGSIPIFATLLGAAFLAIDRAFAFVLMGGFALAYLSYDLLHYGCHQWRFGGGIGAYLKRHHLIHHYVDGERNFGVTSPVWDWFFGTLRAGRRHGR